MEPSVTVLTAVRNGARYIADTVASIRSQSYADWEHIVVDDASEDETPVLVSEMARRDSRVRLIRRTARGGPYVSANEGLRSATGRYVVIIDGDDVAREDRIESQTSFLDANPGLDACAGGWQRIDASGTRIGAQRSPPSSTSRSLSWALPVVSGIAHSTMCIRRHSLVDLGGYAELSIAADYALWLELARTGRLGVLTDVVVDYRSHDAGISRDFETLRAESLSVLGSHMSAMTGERWEPDAIAALWSTGRWYPTPLAAGFDSLDRWERAWRSDPLLTGEDRSVLRKLGARLRLRHVKWNHGGKPIAAAFGLARWIRMQLGPWERTALGPDS